MLRRRPKARQVAALALAALTCAGSPARGDGAPTDAALTQARERFAAARKLEDAGRWAEALTAFQRVAEVKTTPQVRFHLALCMENVGMWAQALDGYAQAAGEAGTAAPDVLSESNEHLRKLEATMPTVSLHVEGAAASDELYLDRRRVSLDAESLAIRADPGPHTAEVRRGGAVVAREYFALTPRSTRRLELHIGTVSEAAPPGEAPRDPAAPPERPAGGRLQRTLGWTAVGVGGASVVVAGVFIGLRAGAMRRLEAACPTLTGCSRTVQPIVGEGKTDAALVNVFAVIGGVAAATGVVLLLTEPSPAAPSSGGATAKAARLELTPVAGPGAAGIVARGVF